jgi:hypothetical protein
VITYKPLSDQTKYINCHTGADYFSCGDSIKLLNTIDAYETSLGLSFSIGHETHRSRILYSPWKTRELLPHLSPGVKLTLDLSHWITGAHNFTTKYLSTITFILSR